MSKKTRGVILLVFGIALVIFAFFGTNSNPILLLILFCSGLGFAAAGFAVALKESPLLSRKP